ncbi:hypothetical protein AVEN_133903-1 [Araneus ventricosus]|uniref:Uncharacterized protein n=1 Tax=Araneus ventricosus TaxID=182803 RepID=A0A4Y2D4X8_ARAVE|nr:hypothetical protein AVEN_133903-1 [Araneus ventricosus]
MGRSRIDRVKRIGDADGAVASGKETTKTLFNPEEKNPANKLLQGSLERRDSELGILFLREALPKNWPFMTGKIQEKAKTLEEQPS